jgi:hypothetical protein
MTAPDIKLNRTIGVPDYKQVEAVHEGVLLLLFFA